MKKLINKPHIFFIIMIPFVLLLGLLKGDETLDINIHDTYFVFYGFHLTVLISFIFALISLGYWLVFKTKRKFYDWIILLHILLSLLGVLSCLGMFFIPRYYTIHDNQFVFILLGDLEIVLTLGILIFFPIQLLYPINIFLALIRRKND